MANKPGVRHYFAEGLTTRGYISLLPNMAVNWKRVYVLIGGPGTGKSTMIKTIGMKLFDRGQDIDFIRSAKEVESIVGFVIPEKGICMLDALEVSPLRWKAPGLIETFVDFTEMADLNSLKIKKELILETQKQLSKLQEALEDELADLFGEPVKEICYDLQGKGGTWMTHSIAKLNLARENSSPWIKAKAVLDKIQKSIVTPCFLHGLNPEGWLNLAPHFLLDYDQILLEGDETLEALSWVLQEAQLLGQFIEIILHPLHPEEVIGVVFPRRHLAMWLGNPENLKDQGLDRPFSKKLTEILIQTQNQRAFLKSLYMETMDFNKLDLLREKLINSILFDLEEKC